MAFTTMSYFETKIFYGYCSNKTTNLFKKKKKQNIMGGTYLSILHIREYTKCRRRFLFLRAGVKTLSARNSSQTNSDDKNAI